ncbi:MAG TPA: PhzF family phenazine biosynthesis protein [Bacteroidota bacterium]|nr:PhzF family phenazine biosynthesis protein [Bacteroidota bacterium]
MKSYKIKHVDAFTSEPFTGNPAGVVVDARGLSEAVMQRIGNELNLSETAFVLPPSVKGADLQIRWFTPASEVPLCGHATIASFHALAEEGMHGMKRPGVYHFRLQTKSGILGITVEKKYSGSIIEFQLPIPKFHEHAQIPSALLEALRIRRSDLDGDLPYVSQSYLYLPLRKLSTIRNMNPDLGKLDVFTRKCRTLGISLFTLETVEESSAVHSRFYAPAVGIVEDPVTGSANGPLGVYLYNYVLSREIPVPSFLLPDGRMELIGEQGDDMGRRGRVKIRMRVTGHGVKQVSIAGEAVTIMDAVSVF